MHFLLSPKSKMEKKIQRFKHCLICLKKERIISAFTHKQKTSLKFVPFVCRYLGLDNALLTVENTLKLPKYGNNTTGDKWSAEEVCDACSPLLQTFCEIYAKWQILQLDINRKLGEIEDVMLKSEDNTKNGEEASTEKFSELRRVIMGGLKAKRQESYPHLRLHKAPKGIPLRTYPRKRPRTPPPGVDSEEIIICYDRVKQEEREPQEEDSKSLLPFFEPKIEGVDNSSINQNSDLETDNLEDPLSMEPAVVKSEDPTPKKPPRNKRPRCKPGTIHECPTCGRCFRSPSQLSYHIRGHTQEKRFECKICGKRMREKGDMNKHERLHSGERPYSCKFCKKTFKRADQCKNHEVRVHQSELFSTKTPPGAQEQIFICRYCGKSFADKILIYQHERTHTHRAKCKYCQKELSINALRQHEKIHNAEENSRQCQFCPRKFVHLGSLQIHERTHTGDRPFKCGTCGKGFSDKGGLVKHERIHSGERPYRCKFCQKDFRDNCDLKRHVNIHTREKSYNCSFCGKNFAQRIAMRRHELTHTGERPFECEFCGRKFAIENELRRHVKRMHKSDNRDDQTDRNKPISNEASDHTMSQVKGI